MRDCAHPPRFARGAVCDIAGDVRVVDIGFPDELIPTTTGLTEPADVVSILPGRATDAHKRASGTLVVVAGSRRMTGAVKLVARAASRMGAGYVIVAVPRSILATVQTELTETVFVPLEETEEGTVAPAGATKVMTLPLTAGRPATTYPFRCSMRCR